MTERDPGHGAQYTLRPLTPLFPPFFDARHSLLGKRLLDEDSAVFEYFQ